MPDLLLPGPSADERNPPNASEPTGENSQSSWGWSRPRLFSRQTAGGLRRRVSGRAQPVSRP